MKGNRYARGRDPHTSLSRLRKEKERKLARTTRVKRLKQRLTRIRTNDNRKQGEEHQSALMESYIIRRRLERAKEKAAKREGSDDDGDDDDSAFSSVDYDAEHLAEAQVELPSDAEDAAAREEEAPPQPKVSYYAGKSSGPKKTTAREWASTRDSFYHNHGSSLRPGATTNATSLDTETRFNAMETKKRLVRKSRKEAHQRRRDAYLARKREQRKAKKNTSKLVVKHGERSTATPVVQRGSPAASRGSGAPRSVVRGSTTERVPLTSRTLTTRSLY